ncbi:unnamed protein product [Schistosoma margrebowiei]|uniref:Uncharacterized protein n=1 Tax=Schistosoma margrebowiei TaxID=48269 RepID=A0A3P8ARE9_9TREM|nr:unnamed protein product [Schistosoma margrebowiei]
MQSMRQLLCNYFVNAMKIKKVAKLKLVKLNHKKQKKKRDGILKK